MRGQDETGRVHIKQVHYHILKFYIVVAGTDLWVYNAENLCVSFFNQVASIFHFGGETKLAYLMHRGIFGSLGENLFQTFSYRKTDKKWVLWSLFLRTAALMDGWVNRIPWLAYDEKPDLLLWWPSCINFERINLTYFPRTHIPFMYYPLLQCIVLNWLTDSLLTRRLDCWPWQCVQHLAIYIC